MVFIAETEFVLWEVRTNVLTKSH